MTELTNLNSLSGQELTDEQLRGLLAQIDLDITNLVRDGKLAALRYGVGGAGGQTTDRAANLRALLAARDHYQNLLAGRPGWAVSRGEAKE